MPPVARIYDICTGHGCFPPRMNIQGSPDVVVNNRVVHRQDDAWATHCCGPPCHASSLAAGDATVEVNNKQLGRIGDPVKCGSSIATGSHNVIACNTSTYIEITLPALEAEEVAETFEYEYEEVKDLIEVAGRDAPYDSPGETTPTSYPADTPPATIPDPVIEEGPEEPAIPPVNVDCANPEASGFTASFQLSPNFTLGDLTTGAYYGHTLRAQYNHTEAQIVCNLMALSVNILEPLLAQFPGAFRINSGFRKSIKGESQHFAGEAVDVQLISGSVSGGYEMGRWIRDNLPYDQYIIEHGNGIWHHISYRESGQRGKINHKLSGSSTIRAGYVEQFA